MRLYAFFAVLAVILFVAGFLGIVAGWVGVLAWFLAAVCLLASWLSWRARAAARQDPDPE
ncbi:MAG TPA: hypothetical protein VHC86_14415 [Opitutaceae bacterium]|nr:hypothetical protein [Opitutaceae bacterium]